LPEDVIDEMDARARVAVLMIALGQDTTAEVMKYMTDYEIQDIAQAISELDVITTEQEDEVLAEFEQLLTAGKFVSMGGRDFARGALEQAFGQRRAQGMLDRLGSSGKSGFQMLRHVDAGQIIPFVSKEHPQTIALILSQLDPAQAAGVLNGLSESKQADVAFRIAQMEHISPQVIRDLEENLATDLQAILSGQVTDIGGPKIVAEILNRVGRSTERAVLERLDANDPELAEHIRNQMFVFDDIAQLTDREIQMLLREVDTKDLAIALKGAAEDLRERILTNMSERVGAMLREEMAFLGPVRMSDVEEMQLRVVQTVRQLEEAGQITVVRGDGSEVLL
jgi:flagellar motor switch protein FliG